MSDYPLPVIEQAARIVHGELEKLAAEGSAEAIALALRAKKIKARRGDNRACAIALDLQMALNEELGEEHGVTVSVNGGPSAHLTWGAHESTSVRGVDHTMRIFIHDFDGNKYPELVG